MEENTMERVAYVIVLLIVSALLFFSFGCGAKKKRVESTETLAISRQNIAILDTFVLTSSNIRLNVFNPDKTAKIERTEKGWSFENIAVVESKMEDTKSRTQKAESKDELIKELMDKTDKESEGTPIKSLNWSLFWMWIIIITIFSFYIFKKITSRK